MNIPASLYLPHAMVRFPVWQRARSASLLLTSYDNQVFPVWQRANNARVTPAHGPALAEVQSPANEGPGKRSFDVIDPPSRFSSPRTQLDCHALAGIFPRFSLSPTYASQWPFPRGSRCRRGWGEEDKWGIWLICGNQEQLRLLKVATEREWILGQ